MSSELRTVGIVGGGTAGYLTALALRKKLPHLRVTLIESPDIPIIGVMFFPYRNLTVDHIVPKAKGGTDHIENLQLLCGACNSKKHTRTQEEFLALLRIEGLRQ